ncbi:MAG: tRNA (adenosine(37)-N6)-threonylcarbamoyltransferase complex transferase subunit TsaD [bacterium]|nr:tRNA (adenosine(37)-N6)-threonylcarbamoyltransferase complex transferase subunit TsaD [bacterium]
MSHVILAIESSCDESAVAVLRDGDILAHQVASQIKWHKKFGGVMPELASRMHTEKLNILLADVVNESGLAFSDFTHVAVTYGPGLEGALLTGLAVGKTLALQLGIPCIGVNHLHGHIYAAFSEPVKPVFPCVTLLVSGGHTALIHCKDHFDFEIVGQTRDDACGEAFDKVARVINLAYPGGPSIESAALSGDERAFRFPRAMRGQLDFSFSGLKTAVKQAVEKVREQQGDPGSESGMTGEGGSPIKSGMTGVSGGMTGEGCGMTADVAASFQAAVADTLIEKSLLALDQTGTTQLVFSGGVAANAYLRGRLEVALLGSGSPIKSGMTSTELGMTSSESGSARVLIVPSPKICTDNAVMIGLAAHYAIISDRLTPVDRLSVQPGLPMSEGCVVA